MPKTRRIDSGNAKLTPKQAKIMQAISEDGPSCLGLFERVYAGKAAPRSAIKAQCLHCVWLDRKAITECTATNCPLWAYRPFQP